ncbi:ABC transporter ATP-binding protein [Coleofasciculus sp. FACHB-SPT9]|uniref:ABC transporter ATP-binding protein n=1 Tax=Cyanophyceae TaxID=3028117 RepID=UPI001687BE20|nr:ABC transporter ATP-binding protein [Coleofasciculus sp. FACHB-SPT9]MBD1890199.1 ABC transporter ATP-binding protein [Coleofasciculus sp. FACHB-SPT9]
MQPPAILRLQNVTKQFSQNTIPAVEDVTLTLQPGDLLGLLGPSGCGKTTLLRLIAGFERPYRGSVEIAGRTVADSRCWVPPEHRDVGIVFQDYALFPHLSVAENVAFGLQQLSKQQVKERTQDAIALVGLQGLEKRYPHELSGGQQQRVALARALAPRPKLVLLDEPLSNLDIQVRLRLREEVREILKAIGTSAIFVTHDQEEALAISDWVGVMRQGHLEQLGTPEDIYTHPASRFVAEFVTQANFLPAQRQGHLWETEVGCFDVALNGRQDPISSLTGELMIRQEDLILQPFPDASVVIRTRRFLGREYRYCLQTPSGKELHARTMTDTALPVGTRVQLSIAGDTVRVFPS